MQTIPPPTNGFNASYENLSSLVIKSRAVALPPFSLDGGGILFLD
jgi:hypothetical protein